jgi:hypothetical protein
MRKAFPLCVLAVTACAAPPPSGLLDETPVHLDATYGRVLVVGVGEDETSRRALEAAFSGRLPGSVPAYAAIPGDTPSAAAIRAAAARVGADAILALRLLNVHDHSDGLPGYVHALPASATPVGFAAFYNEASLPGTGRYEAASIEVDLWALRTDSLDWSALTPVFTPTDASAVTASAALSTGAALNPAVKR